MFALADNGEQVVIRRRGKVSYMLTPVYEEDFVLSPELEERLEEGRNNTGRAMSRPVLQRKNLINSWKRYELV